MHLLELDKQIRDFGTTNPTRNVIPVRIMNGHVNLAPMIPKLSQSKVFPRFLIALLGVALDAHGLIVPLTVGALLALWDDVVPIHEDGPLIALMVSEQINVLSTAVVKPNDDDVAHSTATGTHTTMKTKRLETVDHVGLTVGRLDFGALTGTKRHFQRLFEGKLCYDVHENRVTDYL